MHELIEDLVHNGELGAGHCLKGRLVAGLVVEYVPVVDLGFFNVHVVVAEDIFFYQENARCSDSGTCVLCGQGSGPSRRIW